MLQQSISYVVWGVVNQPANKKGVGPKVGAEWQDREYLGQATNEPSVLKAVGGRVGRVADIGMYIDRPSYPYTFVPPPYLPT
jgi:hypothetical protein